MNGKIFVVLFFIGLVIFSSGCLNNECGDLEKELAARNLTCKCTTGKVIPEVFENRTDIKPKCFCVCNIDGEWQNISVVQVME